MVSGRNLRWVICVAGLLVFCAKQQNKVDTHLAVIGTDTLTRSKVLAYVPDTLLDSQQVRRTAVALVATKDSGQDSVVQADAREFSEQLSLTTSREWSVKGAALLLSAARQIYRRVDTFTEPAVMCDYLDSLYALVEYDGMDSLSPQARQMIDSLMVLTDTSYVSYKKAMARLFGHVLFVDTQIAELLSEFVLADKAVTSAPAAKQKDIATIKGLIADSTAASVEKKQPVEAKKAKTQAAQDNSRLALKHRDQQSIKDSIAGHIPEIQALYKKHLKVHQDMGGIVYVRFEVNTDGRVRRAGVANSQIQEKDFIDPFLGYVKNIQFKPITGSVGVMTFDFPFEFSPES